jgi:hypothetical protein
MGWTLPEVAIRRVLDDGIRQLRSNKTAFIDIFSEFSQDELATEYGDAYIEQIWEWFATTKVPVIQSWSFNAQKIPCISVHLANEQEADDKVAMDDYMGTFDQDNTTGTAAFTVMLDIGIHANKGGDQVLWLYYIVSYLLFRLKPTLVRLGLEMGTYSASDYSKDAEKMGNNIWTRWVRYRCTTQNSWAADPLGTIDEVNTDPRIGLQSTEVAASSDVDITQVDLTENKGLKVGRIGDEDGEDDLSL